MTHRLTTNFAKNYCNRTLIVKVIVENVVTCFLGHGVESAQYNMQINVKKTKAMVVTRNEGIQAKLDTKVNTWIK